MDFLSAQLKIDGTRARWYASQGSYFKATNATPGTGIVVSSTQQTFSATKGMLCLQNTAPANSNVFLFPDHIRLTVSVVDVAATSFQYVIASDSILRYSSGGTQIVTPGTYASNNGPMNALRAGPAPNIKPFGPQGALFFGDLTYAAESGNVVRGARGCMKSNAAPLTQVNDEFLWSFAPSEDVGAGQSKAGAASNPTIFRQNVGSFGIGPQCSMVFNTWAPAVTTGPTFELEVGWYELAAYPA